MKFYDLCLRTNYVVQYIHKGLFIFHTENILHLKIYLKNYNNFENISIT